MSTDGTKKEESERKDKKDKASLTTIVVALAAIALLVVLYRRSTAGASRPARVESDTVVFWRTHADAGLDPDFDRSNLILGKGVRY